MNSLLDFIWRRTRTFYPFERNILESIVTEFRGELGVKLLKQIDVVNRVQRLQNGKEVNLYKMRRGQIEFDESLRFTYTKDEFMLARVRLTWSGSNRLLEVTAWMANGRFFSLEFSEPPQRFFAGTALHTVRPEVVQIEVYSEYLNAGNEASSN